MARRPHRDRHEAHGPGHEGPSQRQLRVGEVIRHKLSDIFSHGDLQDPDLRGARLTVSEVRVAPDMRHASVFVMKLGGGDMGRVLKALERARGFLRREVGGALTTKFTPELAFIEDKSFDEAQHIAEILHSKDVRGDLEPSQDEDRDGAPEKR